MQATSKEIRLTRQGRQVLVGGLIQGHHVDLCDINYRRDEYLLEIQTKTYDRNHNDCQHSDSAQKHSSMRPRRSIQPKIPLGTMRTPSGPSGLYYCSVPCILGAGNNLLCNRDNTTEVTGVNGEVGGRALRYNTRVENRVDGRDLGDDGYNRKCWQRGRRTGSRTTGRHSKTD